MPPPPDLLSGDFWVEALGFWAKDSESLYRLALIVAGLVGIPLLYSRTRSANRSARAALEQAKVAAAQSKTAADRHDEQTKADRERRITESFAKAGEQLGSDKLETRLVGIYTLERIARESAREYWPIMETLTAFVRERAPWPLRQALANPFVEFQAGGGDETKGENTPAEEPKAAAEPPAVWIRPATDVQAVLTILGRRDEQARKQDRAAGRRLDLAATDLRGARLAYTHLEGAYLPEAHLEGASLWEAHLEGAFLRWAHLEGNFLFDAHLEGAVLTQAHLERTNLWRAHLEGAELQEAHLEGASLRGAHLEGADLRGAHLEDAFLWEAVGLRQEQLESASGDDRTQLPEGLTPPAHWAAAPPDAPDNPE